MRAMLAGAALVGAVALTGCSGGADTSSSTSADSGAGSGAGVASKQLAAGSSAAAGSAAGSAAGGARRAAVRTAAVIRTGDITLVAEDVPRVRGRIIDLLDRDGGSVDRETSRDGRDGRVTRSTLVLRVPVEEFARVRDAISGFGTVRSSTENAEDVTTQVIDTDERVQTLRNSLDRLQRFQRSAEDVEDLIAFEHDITDRQAELQSLKGQQSYLSDQTSMSTITVRLSTPAADRASPGALHDAGFVTGLRGGWHALGGFVVVVLTALGAVLPFAVPAVLVGVPVWRLLRRRRSSRSAAGTPA